MAGAILKFSDDPADYPVINSRIEGAEGEVLASCLYAEKAKNISVTGFGCLNGNGQKWWHIQRNNKESLRSEEHTSELQSRGHLVCRLLLEKKKDTIRLQITSDYLAFRSRFLVHIC